MSKEKQQMTPLMETLDIAWPAVLESVFVALVGMVDTKMLSPLGQYAVSAAGITGQPKYFVLVMFFAVNIAISALIARRKGAGLRKEANALFSAGLHYIIIAGVILSILCVIFARPIMIICGSQADTTEPAVVYFRIIMGGMLFNTVSLYINAAQRGSGNTKISMYTNITSNLVNIFFNYLLIQGHWGFPALGVAGAAIATVIGTVIACIMSILSLFRKDSYISVSYIKSEKVKPTSVAVKDLSNVGGNILCELLLTRVGFMITGMMTARLGTNPFAAHQVGMNFMNLGFAFGDGMQIAAVALIGRSLGEKDVNKAKMFGKTTQKIGFVMSITTSVIMLLFGKQIFSMFFPQEEMVEMGVIIFRFIALIMPIQICKIIFNGILRGAGDVRYTLVASAIGITLVQPILTYLFMWPLHMGITGVWCSIFLTQFVQLLLFGARYFSGKWTQKKI